MNNRIKKISNLVKPFLSNTNQQYMNIAMTEHKFKGPICDDEGFTQHKGECWNDTLQEVFFFSDGIKDITQPLFYNLDTSSEYLTPLVSSKLFPDNTELTNTEQNTVNKLVKYIRLMKIRFVTHYNYLIDFETHNIPILEKIHMSKRRYSAVCGIAAAKHIINLHKGNSNVYVPGLNPLHKNELFNNLIRIFNIPFIATQFKSSDKLSNINGIFISSNFMKLSDTNTYTYKGSHAFGFLKCDSKWKYYDDNERSGLIEVDENLVSVYITEENVAIGVDTTSNTHILKYKLHTNINGNIKSSVATITQYYNDNKWNNWNLEWNTTHPFKRIYTKNLVSIVRPRIKWANIRRRVGGTSKKILHNIRKTIRNKHLKI
jgi:hypothetical protein